MAIPPTPSIETVELPVRQVEEFSMPIPFAKWPRLTREEGQLPDKETILSTLHHIYHTDIDSNYRIILSLSLSGILEVHMTPRNKIPSVLDITTTNISGLEEEIIISLNNTSTNADTVSFFKTELLDLMLGIVNHPVTRAICSKVDIHPELRYHMP